MYFLAQVFVYSTASRPLKLAFSADFSRFSSPLFNWDSCERCSFNKNSTFLLLSGVLGDQIINKERGEAVVFNIKGAKYTSMVHSCFFMSACLQTSFGSWLAYQ